MDRTERFYHIDRLLHSRECVPLGAMMDELGVSRATVKRDLEYMRDRLNAPIVWDRSLRGYRYDHFDPAGNRYALPGLWLNGSEIHALLAMEHLLENLQPGLLGPHIGPLRERIRMLMGASARSSEEITKRIRVLTMAARQVKLRCFEEVANALLSRKRLWIRHYSRDRDEYTEREVSPQRLVHYRDNWYLDAWCHLRDAIRSFSVDAVRKARLADKPAFEVSAKTLDEVLGAGYGIFPGENVRWAVLRFSPHRARWVSRERWHSEQKTRFDAKGRFILEVPYSDHRELMLDILHHGSEVEVLKPESLRQAVYAELECAAKIYRE